MKKLLLCTTVALAWAAFVFVTSFYGWWTRPVVSPGDTGAFFAHAESQLESESRGNSALVLIEDGQVRFESYSADPQAVNADTLFSLASMSKWFAAYGAMLLVEQGKVALDTPVTEILTRWQLPPSEFDNSGVTLRALLSHTAGLDDGLGFGDYTADETLPTLEESLAAPRASGGRAVEIAVTSPPGEAWNYSGGGYLILELLIEEVSGQSFADYMGQAVFEPLGMQRSGYGFIDGYNNSAGSYALDGSRAPSYQYAAKAATALASSAADVTRFVQTQLAACSGGANAGPLSCASLEAMREPHGRSLGADVWGLGTMLYAPTQQGGHVFGHDGGNDPAINAAVRVNPDTGDALIILLTGELSLATRLGSDWVLWQTGMPDILASEAVIASMLTPLLLGWLALGFALILWRRKTHAA
jgi:CubicO group peptidase (beta-lactamase class C family)